jgi:hypothetical protein
MHSRLFAELSRINATVLAGLAIKPPQWAVQKFAISMAHFRSGTTYRNRCAFLAQELRFSLDWTIEYDIMVTNNAT